MTWAKYGTEFFDQLVDMDFPDAISDACMLTHTQALHYLYSVESLDMTFPKTALRRIATSSLSTEAAQALVQAGAWADQGKRYAVKHHEDVFRQSLGYQLREKTRTKEAMRKKRSKEPEVTHDVTRNETRDVTRDVMRTQTDRQTNNHSLDQEVVVNKETGELPMIQSSDLDASGWPQNITKQSPGGGTNGPSAEALNRWKRPA